MKPVSLARWDGRKTLRLTSPGRVRLCKVVVMVMGRVQNGVVVLEDGEELEEGAMVVVRTVDADDHDPDLEISPEEEEELLQRYEDCKRGQTVSHEEVMASLRAIRDAAQEG